MLYDIVGLVVIGQVLIVMMKGQFYIVQGFYLDLMLDVKIEVLFVCINSCSIVNFGFGVVYVVNEGLVLIWVDGFVMLVIV